MLLDIINYKLSMGGAVYLENIINIKFISWSFFSAIFVFEKLIPIN